MRQRTRPRRSLEGDRRLVATCLSTIAALVALAGCTNAPLGSALAVWELAPDSTVDAQTTTLTVLVNRVGCNDGVTGTVNTPDINVDEAEVVVTFFVSPGEPLAANCSGNNSVAYDVVLPEPLGDRRLLDGACDRPEARSLVFCEPDGIRSSP